MRSKYCKKVIIKDKLMNNFTNSWAHKYKKWLPTSRTTEASNNNSRKIKLWCWMTFSWKWLRIWGTIYSDKKLNWFSKKINLLSSPMKNKNSSTWSQGVKSLNNGNQTKLSSTKKIPNSMRLPDSVFSGITLKKRKSSTLVLHKASFVCTVSPSRPSES